MIKTRSGTKEAASQLLRGDVKRFLGAGIFNTLVSMLVYQLLLFVISAPVAYAITWLAGLTFVALVYPTQVFRGGDASGKARIATICVYLASFGVGLVTTKILSVAFQADRLAIIVTLGVTTFFNFVVMRVVLRRGLKR